MKININELRDISNLTIRIDDTKDLVLSTSQDRQTLDIEIKIKTLTMENLVSLLDNNNKWETVKEMPPCNGLITDEKNDVLLHTQEIGKKFAQKLKINKQEYGR